MPSLTALFFSPEFPESAFQRTFAAVHSQAGYFVSQKTLRTIPVLIFSPQTLRFSPSYSLLSADYHTGLYQELQNRLKDAVRKRWKDYDEIRRSINQYLSGVVCEENPGLAVELEELKKTKLEGKVARGLELLEVLLAQDQSSLQAMNRQIEELEQKIQAEDQHLGKIRRNQQLRVELDRNQQVLNELLPELEQARKAWEKVKAASLESEKLSEQIQIGLENLRTFQKLEEDQKKRKENEVCIQADVCVRREKEKQKQKLEQQVWEEKKYLDMLKTAGEEKERLAYQKERLERIRNELHTLRQSRTDLKCRQEKIRNPLEQEQKKEETLSVSIGELQIQIESLQNQDALLVSLKTDRKIWRGRKTVWNNTGKIGRL